MTIASPARLTTNAPTPPIAAPTRVSGGTIVNKPTFGKVVGLPSNRKCASRRKFRIRIRQPGGIQIQTALVFVNGKKVRVLTRKVFQKKRKVAAVNLRGLPRGVFKVRIVVLTGFASIATAVEAIKLGASHYLAKPANTDDIERAFGLTGGNPDAPVDGRQSSIKTVEWEHIHQTLVEVDFNISEAARRLGMHRRTLARKLEKRPLR